MRAGNTNKTVAAREINVVLNQRTETKERYEYFLINRRRYRTASERQANRDKRVIGYSRPMCRNKRASFNLAALEFLVAV